MSSEEELKQEVERLKAENMKLKKPARDIYLKVSQKGGVSLYGLGRFPVTLYKGQWERLLDKKEDIITFISENESSLTVKE